MRQKGAWLILTVLFWYPAKVVLLSDVPPGVQAGLRKDDGKSVIVQFYGDLDYSRVGIKKLTELGQSNQDLRWSRFPDILEKCNLTLAGIKFR